MATPQQPRNRLLTFNDPHPMRIDRDLAAEIGLNESIVLLQIEYLISISNKERDGRLWTYQTLADLKDVYFPWWSVTTLHRIVKNLEQRGLIVIGNYNKLGYDRTQWFALNEEGINSLHSVAIFQNEKSILQNEKSIFQNDKIDLAKMKNGSYQNETTIPESTTENTQRKKDRAPRRSADAPPAEPKEKSPHQAIMDAYQQALGYPIPDGAAAGTSAKELVKMGYTPEQVAACYASEKAREFWQDKHLSLMSLKKNIGAWAQAQENKNRAAKRPPAPLNKPVAPPDVLRPDDAIARLMQLRQQSLEAGGK